MCLYNQQRELTLIAIIFEVEPAKDEQENYLKLAQQMKAHLEQMDGFISVERFQSLATPGKLLSLSFWRDEESVERWRSLEAHRRAQKKGREELFANYRLRVAHVLRDYGMEHRAQAPDDSKKVHGG